MPLPLLRPAVPPDLDALKHIADASAMFQPDELAGFAEQMQAYFQGDHPDHHWTVSLHENQVVGAAYLAPEMAPGVFNLLFIAVRPDQRRRGHAGALVADAERRSRDQSGRMILVDTSSLEQFRPARSLYLRLGYDEHARIADYWKAGDDKVTFRKAL